MAVIIDAFESQYFIQDREGNVWGEIKPTYIEMEQNPSELPKIELTGYLSFDVDKVKRINETKIKMSDSVETVKLNELAYQLVSITNPYGECWEKHCKDYWEISENDKGGNEMEILEIWKERKKLENQKAMREAKKEINKRDEIVKRVKELETTLEEEYGMFFKISLKTGALTQESEEKLTQIEQEHKDKEYEIAKKEEEILAQLKICETYEQKIDILVAYGIIDKKTKQILA